MNKFYRDKWKLCKYVKGGTYSSKATAWTESIFESNEFKKNRENETKSTLSSHNSNKV